MSEDHQIKLWQPCETLLAKKKTTNYAVIILNTPIKHHPTFLLNLWEQAQFRVIVDGGGNQWLSWLNSNHIPLEAKFKPELIVGDLDSISDETLKCLTEPKTCVIKTPNQNETDYTKSLREISNYCTSQNVHLDDIFVIVETCGRFDQIMANINTLFKAKTLLPDINLFQIASNSLTWLLMDKYKHVIEIPEILREIQEWCALMPFLKPTRTTTTGLKWDLNNREMKYGQLVSTSNTYNGSPTVCIEIEYPIIWSMGIENLPLDKQTL